eukprot:CAMPEP_0181237412 /NCGR_PEP_ID=MMETSP1096-20121128/38745_1 /TAXON_ID=156174 ORGANISM="Chrysochromulina ericina, Strain CCMP281" /NCGR_SAMPLE_ID=MMETSP1096 /ASSEMBLY_ACC=CAM_ASM_000453 /LENGTH=46 /DNA_ID= /DNA_START= /DNA_END= /DNA_ORIENTATION=
MKLGRSRDSMAYGYFAVYSVKCMHVNVPMAARSGTDQQRHGSWLWL